MNDNKDYGASPEGVRAEGASGPMTLAEWDAYVGGISSTSEFILAEQFECAEGQMLARVLASVGWPQYQTTRMYARAGDNSNFALRALERKYHAALKLLTAAGAAA